MRRYLPLPYRIPRPGVEQATKLGHLGISIYPEEPADQFVRFGLPPGWKIVNDSPQPSSPSFYIIDETRLIRVAIYGTWYESFYESDDNNLSLRVLEETDIKRYDLNEN